MARKPTTQTQPSEPQADVLPELDDDTEIEPVAAAANSDEQPESDAPAQAEPARSEKYNPREEAVRRYRERRKQQEAAAAEDAPDPVVEAADDVEPAAEEAPVEAAPAEEPPAEVEPEFTLLVDGKPVKMKQSEVLAKAQIAVASDNRLDEAKRLLQEARALRGQSADPQHQRSEDDDLNGQADGAPDGQDKANQQRPAIDKDRLREIVQKLQVGDEEEGVSALEEVVNLLGDTTKSPQITQEEVGRLVVRSQMQSELQGAAEAFQGKHSALVADPELRDVSFGRIRNEVRSDLEGLGFDAQTLAGLTGEQLFNLHMDARSKGAKVRTYNSMFDKVGADMTARYGAVVSSASPQRTQSPAPAADGSQRIAQDRIDRKRTALQQPRTAGMRQAPPPQKQAKSKAEIIAEMRRARGFNA